MERISIDGGEHWVGFARSRIQALLLAGLGYARQSYTMPDGAEVMVGISDNAHTINIKLKAGEVISGVVKGGAIIETAVPAGSPPGTKKKKVLRAFKASKDCAKKVLRSDKASEKFEDLRYLKTPRDELFANESDTGSQVGDISAGMYSGKMKKVMQVLLGMKTPTEIKYMYDFYHSTGVFTAKDESLWIVHIDKNIGVIARPLERTKASDDKNATKVEQECFKLFKGVPTGRFFPKTKQALEKAIADGKVLKLATKESLEDFYKLTPYYYACGWSFNNDGSEAHNTGLLKGTDTGLVGKHMLFKVNNASYIGGAGGVRVIHNLLLNNTLVYPPRNPAELAAWGPKWDPDRIGYSDGVPFEKTVDCFYSHHYKLAIDITPAVKDKTGKVTAKAVGKAVLTEVGKYALHSGYNQLMFNRDDVDDRIPTQKFGPNDRYSFVSGHPYDPWLVQPFKVGEQAYFNQWDTCIKCDGISLNALTTFTSIADYIGSEYFLPERLGGRNPPDVKTVLVGHDEEGKLYTLGYGRENSPEGHHIGVYEMWSVIYPVINGVRTQAPTKPRLWFRYTAQVPATQKLRDKLYISARNENSDADSTINCRHTLSTIEGIRDGYVLISQTPEGGFTLPSTAGAAYIGPLYKGKVEVKSTFKILETELPGKLDPNKWVSVKFGRVTGAIDYLGGKEKIFMLDGWGEEVIKVVEGKSITLGDITPLPEDDRARAIPTYIELTTAHIVPDKKRVLDFLGDIKEKGPQTSPRLVQSYPTFRYVGYAGDPE